MNLAYKNFAFIEGTLRDEYTSYLPPSDNHFMYPSLNTSLLLNEAFSFPRFINYSKIRLSWGMVGNRPLRYQANNSYTQGAVNGIPYSDFKTEYGNDKIKSEKKTEYEFGFENRLFDSRLVLDLTAYYNKTENLIMALAVPASSGSNSMLDNVGTISNRGLEIAATITPVRSKIFNWDIRLNGGLNRNKVEKLIQDVDYLELNWEGAGSVKIVAQEGKPYGEILTYSHKFDSNGNKVIDGDGYWVRDDSKYVSVGNSTPKFVGGISNNINFRNFFVNFLIDYRIGGKILSMTNYYGLNAGKLESSLAFRDKEHGGSAYYVDNGGKKVAWDGTSPIPADNQYAGKFNSDGSTFDGVFNDGMVLEGVDSNGKKNDKIISSADYYQNMFYWKSGFHEYGMFDNSFVKFREITIGYNIPANLTKKIGLQALNVSLIGRNLFYIYKNVPNIDPESMVGTSPAKQAIEYGFVPSSRSFGFALRASF